MNTPKCAYPPCTSAAVAGGGMCGGHREAYLRRNYPNGYFTAAAPVAAHIAKLRAADMTWDQIADAAGMNCNWGIRDIAAGRRRGGRVAVHTAEAIMSVTLPAAGDFTGRPDHALVPMIGATRRVQALVALGYTNQFIAQHANYPVEHMHRLLGGKAPTLTLKAHRAIAELFERIEAAPPPRGPSALRAQRRASERGWALPLAWDLDTIDDPTVTPHTGTARPLTILERYDEAVELGRISVHDALTAAAQYLDVDRDSLGTALLRARRGEQSIDMQQAS